MLKVVGASWEQTRTTSYILILFTFCGLLIIIFGGSVTLNDADGNYAATVYFQPETGYRIEFWGQGNDLINLPKGAARGYYRQDIAENGWSKIEIETNQDFTDRVQAFSAGLLEGSLIWQLVFWRWKNTIEAVCEEYPKECENIRNELQDWGFRMRAQAQEKDSLEPFWHQINIFFAQLDGLITGWNYSIRRNRAKHMEIENIDFLWLQLLATDLPLPDTLNLTPKTPSLTSSLIKLHQKPNQTQEILVAQTTAGPYRDMLRIVKRYIFPFRMTCTEGSAPVPGVDLEFTGYPGALSSQDDLYRVASRSGRHNLIVVGSNIGIGHHVTKFVKYRRRMKRNVEEKVPGTLRALVASRLARGGRTWAAHFNRGHGGQSLDKQWSIVDISKLDTDNNDGLFWVVEHSGGLIVASDYSETFKERSYWASFGVPYHKNIKLRMNFDLKEVKSEREKKFEICRHECTGKEEIYQLIRHAVSPNQEGEGSRADLYKNNPVPFGVIDTKLISAKKSSSGFLEITAGPVHTTNASASEEPPIGSTSPFQWSISAFFTDVRHIGHPDIWGFPPQQTAWLY